MATKPFRLTSQQMRESSEGAALIKWKNVAVRQYPALQAFYHIPNGKRRDPQTGYQLKREGVLRGMPDYCLPVARGGYNALYIELKRRDGGTLSEAQDEQYKLLKSLGNQVIIAAGWEEAKNAILEYLQ